MKYTRSCRKYLLGLSLVLVLTGWLCQPEQFQLSLRPVSAATTFTVNTLGDAGCPQPLQRNCTLRQVIIAANGNPGLDTIRFQITDGPSLVKTIIALSELPAITDPVIIDGTSQPGYAGRPLIELSGASAGTAVNGLTLTAGNTTVKGLIINRFSGDGLLLIGSGNVVEGNYIGTDATGNNDLGNTRAGVRIKSSNNQIGGSTALSRNVISGNNFAGVAIDESSSSLNRVSGNYIGTNSAGTATLGNSEGVFMFGGTNNNIIGGSTPGERNIVSGNLEHGIVISSVGSNANRVQGNFIGTDVSGSAALANGSLGIRIDNAFGTIIGGEAEGVGNVISGNVGAGISILSNASNTQAQGNFIGTNANGVGALGNGSSGVQINLASNNHVALNTIAFNGADGVTVDSGINNSITGNSIFSNNGLGIDLAPNGVTPNDAGDTDLGANNLLNFPILTSAIYSGNRLSVSGNFDHLPGFFRIEFFSSTSCDPSGQGEGESLFASASFGDAGGNSPIGSSASPAPLPAGRFITATATRLDSSFNNPGDTSEFSPCIPLVTTAGTLQFSASSYNVNENAGNASVTISRAGGSDGPASARLSVSNGTATAGQDYADISGTINFANGETSRTVLVPITDDNLTEGDETINLGLSPVFGGVAVGTPSTAVLTINDNDNQTMVHLSSATYAGSEDCTAVVINVSRIGDTSVVSTIDYSASSGTATVRSDFTASLGTLRFGPGDVQKSFVILVNEDSYTEGTETATITLSNPSGTTLGAPSIATLSILDDSSEPTTNAIDDSMKFVCQHYHDFLNRQPDPSGQAFWTNEIESCGTDAQCREVKRVNVSAAFFLSIEFQQTGYLVYRTYKAAYGNMPSAPVPLTLQEFLRDTQAIGQGVQVGIGDWQTLLENNKNAFASVFVARSRFLTAFPLAMTPAQFVDALNTNSGGALSTSERDQLVNELSSGAKTRAQVLRAVAEDQTLAQSEFNRAFVLMQYFGYLRRNPNNIPDSDFSGYNFWLGKLNAFGGNFADAEMVKAFIVSGEYRQRFGP